MALMDEGTANEELAYSTGLSGGALAIPLANRGLEGGSAQAHSAGASVKGVLTSDMWNDLVEALTNVLVQSTGAVDTTKVVTPTGTQTLTNKTLDTPDIDGDADLLDSDGNIQVAGADPWRTVTLMPGLLKPTTTSGCAASSTVEAGTNDIDYDVLDFDASSAERAFANFQMPDSWDAGVVQFRAIWTNAGGGSAETIELEVSGRSFANDDAIDQANGTAVALTDTWIAQRDIHITGWSSDCTLAGTPGAGELVHLEVKRDVANDNLTGDLRLIAIQMRFKQAQFSD